MNLTEQVKMVSLKAEHVKVSIYHAVHREYNDLLPSKSQHELVKSLKPLLSDIQKLEDKFETEVKPKIHAATTQHKDLLDEYQKTKWTTDLLKKLCSCHKELTACKSTESNLFVKRATHLQIVKKELESMKFPESDIKIFKAVRNEFINQQTKLAIDLNDVWERLVVWNTSHVASWDSLDGHLKTTIKVDSAAAGSDIKLADYFQALHVHQLLNQKLKSFSQKVNSYLLKPLIKFQNLAPSIQSKDSHCHMLKITKKKVAAQKITKAASCVLLYKKILETIQFLKTSLFTSLVNNDQSLKPLETIGSFIWKELAETIINDHLSAAVPSLNSQMEKYESTIEETIQFEKDLFNEGFLSGDVDILSKYIKEVNIHFANKVCQDILSEARDIILAEMHNTIEVGMTNDRAAIPMPAEGEILNKKVKNMLLGLESVEDEFLQVNSFAFPSCFISDNIQKLMDFVFRNMIKATESPYPMACQIVYSCRDIFDLFVNVVPTYHQETLKLPRLAALHYNNCMYLSHHCITLGHQFQNSLPGQLNSSMTTFVDLVPVLRKCGTDCFLEQLRTQQKELLNMLEPCEQFTQCVTEEGSETIRRSFNQIIHHLTRVAKQWDNVLPVNIFKQSVAVLINTVLENCIAAVLKMEDISADEAGQLHALLNVLVERSPQIIQSCSTVVVESGINDHIRSWTKFEHIIKLLEASLQEIVDMWDGGEGSLASCMNEGEVRTLLRALFQNTDRRSQALAKIKHKHISS